MKKLLVICILSVIAFVNAVYLTVHTYRIEKAAPTGPSFCDISNTFSCTNVLLSPYSKVFGLPFPAVAMVVYPVIFLIALLGIKGVIRKSFTILAALGLGGMMFNGYFISMEFLYIGSYCPLCLLCSGIIITIFILSVIGILTSPKSETPRKL